jgi:RHS repeat-associated protein
VGSTNAPSQTISLPKGGGAVSGLGEKFTPDPHTGTGNFTLPISVPPGRNEIHPRLNLIYSTGHGSGPFGLGWDLDTPSVARQTSSGVPRYDDSRDGFVLSGSEDLVPTSAEGGVQRYRPRTEGLFARIRRYPNGPGSFWVVEGKDGLISTYGTPSAGWPAGATRDPAAVTRPGKPGQVFSWKLSRTVDSFGNRIEYRHRRDPTPDEGPHVWDQLYLDQIRYGNFGDAVTPSFLVQIKFVYEDRPDPFSSYRAGFEIRTTQRCTRIEVSSNAAVVRRIRTYHLTYLDRVVEPSELPKNGASLLAQIAVEGHGIDPATGQEESDWFPPLEFKYTTFQPEKEQRRSFFPLTGAELPPSSLANPDYELVDLFGNGLPDIVELGATARYWRNLGAGRLAPPRAMAQVPAGLTLAQAGVQIADCDGDGRPDLLATVAGVAGYFPLGTSGEWEGFRTYAVAPSFSLKDPEVRLVDLDGDGITDVVRTSERLECFFNASDRQRAWIETRRARRGTPEEFPDVMFSDPRVRLADLSGDGLQDIVLLYDGNIEYWPNLGRGTWGSRLHMRRSPRFPWGYDQRRILLGDIDGDGLADLVYVENGKVTVWINQAGNQWSEPVVIPGTPPISDADSVRLVDFLGSGVAGLLWSADAGTSSRDRYLFLDLTGGAKPYLLHHLDNHLGSTTRVGYRSSTDYFLEDEISRETRWRTTLPFPVQVVSRVESVDELSGGTLTTTYRYRHGYWDGAEREFRGFALVEQFDAERFGPSAATTALSPPTLTRSWFHPGPVATEDGEWSELRLEHEYWSGDPDVLGSSRRTPDFLRTLPRRPDRRDALRALRGTVLRTEFYAQDGTDLESRPYTVTESSYALVEVDPPADPASPRRRVFFPHQRENRTTQWERGTDPATRLEFLDSYDAYGFAGASLSVAVPRGRDLTSSLPAGTATEPYLASLILTSYARRDDPLRYCVDRVAGTATFEISNDGTTDGFTLHADAIAGVAARRPLGQTVHYYDGPAFTGQAAGALGEHGVLVRSETLVLTAEIVAAAYGPNPPPYLTATGAPAWTAEYPAAFRALPASAGYVYHPAGGAEDFVEGFFEISERRAYDFQSAAGGRGLVNAIRDPLGRRTTFEYDGVSLFPSAITTPDGLTTRASHDYRVFQPAVVTDPNGNQTELRYGPLGFLRESWSRGKGNEGDQVRPSARYDYDLLAFDRSAPDARIPAYVRTRRAMHHDSETDVASSERDRVIETWEYSDGYGRLLQTRTQADDVVFGPAPMGDAGLPCDRSQAGSAAVGSVSADADPPRVVVSGWQVYDNKGRVVEEFEPVYAEGWGYTPAAGSDGPKVTKSYDPRGNVIRTVTPDGGVKQVVHGVPLTLDAPGAYAPTPWETYTYDPNDNSGRTHPAASAGYRHHRDTPASVTLDPLARPLLTVLRNRSRPATPAAPLPPIEELRTSATYDLTGNVLATVDPLGRVAVRSVYDLSRRVLRSQGLDAGVQIAIFDAAGNLVEQRDGRGALLLRGYDDLNRPVALWARDNAGAAVTRRQKLEYGGPGDVATNRAGRLARQFDEAGVLTIPAYDFKGNIAESRREIFARSALDGAAFGVDWDGAMPLDPAPFQLTRSYDALSRIKTQLHPVDVDGQRKLARPRYGRSGAIESLALDGQPVVERIAYNARGQRVLMVRGNGAMTRFAYDPLSARLCRLRTELTAQPAPLTYAPAGAVLQDQSYAYDLAGNVTTIVDLTPDCGVRNNPEAMAYPSLAAKLGSGDALVRSFEYDGLSRLTWATGRECSQIAAPRPWADPTWPGGGSCGSYPAAPTQTNTKDLTSLYAETYEYDPAGNLTATRHRTAGASWSRQLGVAGRSAEQWRQEWTARFAARQSGGPHWTGAPGNQATHCGDDPPGTMTVHGYDLNGNLISRGLEQGFGWDHSNRLREFYVQAGGTRSVEARYCYDAAGERVVKLVRKQGGELEITVAIGGLFERFTRLANGTTVVTNDRIHLVDGRVRIAELRLGAAVLDDPGPPVRYSITDHVLNNTVVLGGATLASATSFINREEFFPYGESSFGSFGRKRFRFVGRERDDESGLCFHGARYYSPFTGRWISPDPSGADAEFGLYSYARDNPIRFVDPGGLQAAPAPTDQELSRAANQALQTIESQMERHQMSIDEHGIGVYQGTRYKPDKKEAKDDQAKAAKANIQVQATNCITLLNEAMRTYQDDLMRPWGQITERSVDARGRGGLEVETARGTTLLKEARSRSDFTTVYVIDPKDKVEWKESKKAGVGPAKAAVVRGADTKVKHDVRLPLDHFVKQKQAIEKLKDVPFGLGITVHEWGFHTFVFSYGNVYEVHFNNGPQDPEVFEKSTLEQFMSTWGSVVIAVPPGPWEYGARPPKLAPAR